MKILLTGGTGFLGEECLDYFSNFPKKYNLYAVYREEKGIKRKNVSWIKLDLTQQEDFDSAYISLKNKSITHIVHIGGSTPNRAYAVGNFNATLYGTKYLTDLAKKLKIKRIVFISSSSVMFSDGPYASSKKSAEQTIIASGLDYVILRPETIIGSKAKDFNRVADMISKQGKFPIIGSGNNTTQPIAVKDVIRMIEIALNNNKTNNHTYPAVGKDIITTKETLQKIFSLKKRKLNLIHIPLWLAYPLSYLANWINPRWGLNPERINIMSFSRKYSLSYLKDFNIKRDSLTSFDEMISFLNK